MSSKNSVHVPTGKQIKKALIDIDQSQHQVAKAIGVSTVYVRYILNGQRKGTQTKLKIANYIK